MAAKRILAVENNELVLSFLEDGLTTAGYDVDTATNGREDLEKIMWTASSSRTTTSATRVEMPCCESWADS